jgi:membrane-bound ClpP family serine protease
VSVWVLVRSLPGNARLTRSGIFLGDRTDRAIGYESSRAREELVGQRGRAITDLRPSGTALIGQERIDVVSESAWIEEGTEVEVVSAEGYRHVVRPVPPTPAREAPAGTEAPRGGGVGETA